MAKRCPIKKHGGKCHCGCLGKKFCKVPLPFTLEPIIPGNEFDKRILATAKKWGKKKAIRTIGRIKEKIEDVEEIIMQKEEPAWFPLEFCFMVPKEAKRFPEYQHQSGGVCCIHHSMRGEIVPIKLEPCQQRVLTKLFDRLSCTSQFYVPYQRVVNRVISYLKLPVTPVERMVDLVKKRDYNDAVNAEVALAESMGYSKYASHEAWQWVEVVGGDFSKCPELEEYKGQRVLMIYPNSD